MRIFLLTFFILSFFQLYSQDWQVLEPKKSNWEIEGFDPLFKKKRNILLITEASIYTTALVGLNELWYSDYPRSSFHFINDNAEWLQMDKVGHMMTSYHSGLLGMQAYQWAGFSKSQSIWYGGLTGTFFLTIIEILDGTSQEWGASSGDLLANTTGSLLAISQAIKWNEQRIQFKYSFSKTDYPDMNPEQLGSSYLENTLKDYNGQTYWATFNLKSLFTIEDNNFPTWLSLAFGYGANGMQSPIDRDGNLNREREFFLSFDVDLNKIETNNKIINTIFNTISFLKFPAPTIQYSNSGIVFHSIYY